MELTPEEFAEYEEVLEEVNQLCFTMWHRVHPTTLLDPKLHFYSERSIEKYQIWQMACAAWKKMTDFHIDPDDMVRPFLDYLTSNRNPDPAQDWKASRDAD